MQKKNWIFRREARRDCHRQKIVDNTYEARLRRLKEELNGPTVTEIIQMHKRQETFQTYDDDDDNDDADDKDKHEILIEPPTMQQHEEQLRKNATEPLTTDTMPLDQSFDRER